MQRRNTDFIEVGDDGLFTTTSSSNGSHHGRGTSRLASVSSVHGIIGDRKKASTPTFGSSKSILFSNTLQPMDEPSQLQVDSWFADLTISTPPGVADPSGNSSAEASPTPNKSHSGSIGSGWGNIMSRQASSPSLGTSIKGSRLEHALNNSSFFNPSVSLTITDDDPAFKNDLGRIHSWFLEDLSGQQRLTTTFALAKELPTWQVEVLLKFLEQEIEHRSQSTSAPSSTRSSPTESTASSSLWGSDLSCPVPVRFPSNSFSQPSNGTSAVSCSGSRSSTPNASGRASFLESAMMRNVRVSSSASVSSNPDSVPVNASLFYSDLPGWLRYHRLHKYQDVFPMTWTRERILALGENDLEALGVSALGARRKFCRLFQLVQESPKD